VRILLVEDDPKLNAIVRQALQEESYAVDVAFDGEQAEEMVFVNRYDAIILDIMLPRKDGLAFCRTLRETGDVTPVLILTARDALQDRVAGLDSGADDYVVKPFHVEELLARLRALLRRQAPVKTSRLTVGDLVVDTAAHAVSRAGTTIEPAVAEWNRRGGRHAGPGVPDDAPELRLRLAQERGPVSGVGTGLPVHALALQYHL
jgi:DNA-binding response OmpR family regulator